MFLPRSCTHSLTRPCTARFCLVVLTAYVMFVCAMKGSPNEILGRVIAPLGHCLTPGAAKKILSLRADRTSRRRIASLAAKCNAGELTPEERAEYGLLVEVGDQIALLQAKARRYLSRQKAA